MSVTRLGETADRLRDGAVALAWSLWHELGVSTWEPRRHQQWAIEVEPLLIFTARVVRNDRRLLEGALDWCGAGGRLLSTTQLKRILSAHPWSFDEDLAAFGASLSTATKVRWPGPTTSASPTSIGAVRLSGKSSPAELSRPALLPLRLRAIFGVSARAEILRVLSLAPGEQTVRAIAANVAYTRRQVELDLDLLTSSEVVRRNDWTAPATYALQARDGFAQFVGALPQVAPRWTSLFLVVTGVLDAFEAVASGQLAAPEVELTRRLLELERPIARSGLAASPPIGPGSSLDEQARWALALIDALAAGDETVLG